MSQTITVGRLFVRHITECMRSGHCLQIPENYWPCPASRNESKLVQKDPPLICAF